MAALSGPKVQAVLVTHDGAPLIRRALAALAAQDHPYLDIVAVDNASTDGTAQVLVELLGPERVVLSDQDVGLPAGIDLGLDALDARDAARGIERRADDLVLIVHDDLVLMRDTVAKLVSALEADPEVAIVGPKLRWLDEPERLQSVGMTIDLTGRVDDGIDPNELDQGQRDGERRVLFVPTAAMLIRREVFDELGRFDRRAQAFREDLDLCWRAAIAGHHVEVVPSAVALHGSLAAEHQRGGRVLELGPRFLAERNTLAALLKNYGVDRLVVVLPLALLVGAAKVAGFLLTRRVGDARDTLAAWAWNIVNLPGTLRRRRRVQRLRLRRDSELVPLFGRVTPRLRAYLEALADRIVGDALPGEPTAAESSPTALLQGELDVVLVGARDVTALDLDAADAETVAVPLLGGEPFVAHLRATDDDDRPRAAQPVAPSDGHGEELTGRFKSVRRRLTRLRARLIATPVRVLLPPVFLLLLLALRDTLLPGPIRGGDLQPFPSGPGLLARHVAGWHDSGATLTDLAPSPAGFLLGVLQLIPVPDGLLLRLLLLVPPLLAWALLSRALAPFVTSPLVRTAAALLYAISPPSLAAVAAGDLVALVVLVALPVLVLTIVPVLDPDAAVEFVWRRLAASVVTLAAVIAFVPAVALLLPVALVAGVAHAARAEPDRRWARTLGVRVALLCFLPFTLLGPWLTTLPDILLGALDGAIWSVGGHPLLWVALDPTGGSGAGLGVALLLAAVVGALLIVHRAPRSAFILLAAGTGLPLVAFVLDVLGVDVPLRALLVAAALALVTLVALGWDRAPAVLAESAFGWRQLAVGVSVLGVAVLAATSLVAHAVRATPDIVRTEAVPAFLATLGPTPADRVLVIGMTRSGVLWEIVPATGPTLASLGVRHDPVVNGLIDKAVADLLDGADPRAAARLGRLGVGIIYMPAGFEHPDLERLLSSQIALDPLPSLSGVVARVNGAIPGAALVEGYAPSSRVPDPSSETRTIVTPLVRVSTSLFAARATGDGDVAVAVPFGSTWSVLIDGVPAPMLSEDGLLRVRDVPIGALVEVRATSPTGRSAGLWVQALMLTLVVSLGARPPQMALRNARRRVEERTTEVAR